MRPPEVPTCPRPEPDGMRCSGIGVRSRTGIRSFRIGIRCSGIEAAHRDGPPGRSR